MCIVIAKVPSASHPTDEVIDECWRRNSHGAGIAFGDVDGGVTMIKGLMTLEELKIALEGVRKDEGTWYLVHFRIATHGSRGPENTHPFWIAKDNVAMAHNGILPIGDLVSDEEGRSDTAAFAEDVLSKLPAGWYRNRAFVHMVEEYMGQYNKIAVIDHEGIELLNKDAWDFDKATGLYFSNSMWKPYVHTSSYVYGGYDDHISENTSIVPGGAPSTQGFRTPTPSKNEQHGAPGAGGSKSKRSRKKDCAALGKRLGSLVAASLIAPTEASLLKNIAVSGEYEAEEIEEFLDFFLEMLAASPAMTMDSLLIATSSRDLYECIDQVLEMSFGDTAKDQDDEAVGKLELELEDMNKDFTLPSIYDDENCKCFIGHNVKLTVCLNGKDTEQRLCRIMGVEDKGYGATDENTGLNYQSRPSGNLGWISFKSVRNIEGLITLKQPSKQTIEQFKECECLVTTSDLKTCHAIIGHLDNNRVWFRAKHSPMRWSIDTLDVIELVVIELAQEPKELTSKA